MCERCGGKSGLPYVTLHHRKKKSHLPKHLRWEPSNCAALCGHGTTGCHGWVESHPSEAEVEGFHVRPWQELGEPFLLHGQSWVKPSNTHPEYTYL